MLPETPPSQGATPRAGVVYRLAGCLRADRKRGFCENGAPIGQAKLDVFLVFRGFLMYFRRVLGGLNYPYPKMVN